MSYPPVGQRPRHCSRDELDEAVDTDECMMADRGIHSRIEEEEVVVAVDTKDGAGMDPLDYKSCLEAEDNAGEEDLAVAVVRTLVYAEGHAEDHGGPAENDRTEIPTS